MDIDENVLESLKRLIFNEAMAKAVHETCSPYSRRRSNTQADARRQINEIIDALVDKEAAVQVANLRRAAGKEN